MDGININNDVNYWQMWGIPLFGSSMSSLLKEMEKKWGKTPIWVATVNPEFVMITLKDRHFMNILQKNTTFNVVDGVGLIWAQLTLRPNFQFPISNFQLKKLIMGIKTGMEILQGKHRESLITGADLMDRLCQVAEEKGRTVYFSGGWDDRSEWTAKYFLEKYPKLKVAGYRAEDFDFKTKVDYLFVARAMKKQEEWIDQHLAELDVKLMMGVGRSFDYYSGELKRAPKWVRKMGLEWLFSLIVEPKRWKRQLELPKFILKILLQG